jgi:hypothetical protein
VKRAASALAAAVLLAAAAAGCGGSSRSGQRTLDAFFADTPRGRTYARRFPHRPGSLPCTALDHTLNKHVPATCSTDLSLEANERVLATFTVSWSHGSLARTWFVTLRRDGSVESVRRENPAG